MELTLYKKQGEVLTSPANELLYGGAAGGGKSHLLRVLSIILCMEIPGVHVYLFRRTFKELMANHLYTAGGYLDMLSEFIDDKIVRYNKSEYVFEWTNGSRIQLCHAQWESDIFNYQGAQIPVLLIDEATHFLESMIRFLRSRLRLGSLQLPDKYKDKLPLIVYASNPGGVSHRYFKKGFVDYSTRVHKAPPNDGGMLRQYVPSLLTDNKMLMENDPHYADRLRGLGKAQLVDAMLSGDWDLSDTAAIADWDAKRHIVADFDIPRTWKVKRGYDYGYSAPYAVIWIAISNGEAFLDAEGLIRCAPKGSIFVIKEIYGADEFGCGIREDVGVTAQKVKAIDKDIPNYVIAGPADNAIFEKEQGPSISELMAVEGVLWSRSNKNPGSRIRGLAVVNKMVTEATKYLPERPCFYVFESCVHTAEQLPHLEVDKDNVEDVDTEQDDHIWDVIRYLALDADYEVTTARVSGF